VTQVGDEHHGPLRGESGTGKELICDAIHYNSLRADKPFIKVMCGAAGTLIDLNFVWLEKGAFTGAQTRKKGRFEMAEGGTLFLDEIGDLNVSTRLATRGCKSGNSTVGGTDTIKVNVRLWPHEQDLGKAIKEGQFGRISTTLNVFSISCPRCASRKSDVLLLAIIFWKVCPRTRQAHQAHLDHSVDMLASYHWPGQRARVANIIERAVLVCATGVIHGHHLPNAQTAEKSGTVSGFPGSRSWSLRERSYSGALKTTPEIASGRRNCSTDRTYPGIQSQEVRYRLRPLPLLEALRHLVALNLTIPTSSTRRADAQPETRLTSEITNRVSTRFLSNIPAPKVEELPVPSV